MNPFIRAGLELAGPFTLKTIPQGAATATYAAVYPHAARHNGEYLVDCNVGESSEAANDLGLARQIWERTERILREVVAGPSQRAAASGA